MTEATEEQAPSPPPGAAVWIRSATLVCILFLMVMYTLHLAASLFMPITLAFLLALIFSPAVRALVYLRVPHVLSAMLVMLLAVGLLGSTVYALATPAIEWVDRAPSELRRLEYKLAWVKEPIKEIQEVRDEVEELAETQPDESEAEQGALDTPLSLVDMFLGFTPDFVYGIAVTLILMFFVLAAGDSFLNKMVHLAPSLQDKKQVVSTARGIQHQISVYLATITFINTGVALVVAVAMYLLDMPSPLLWGVLVGVLNFVPYLGVAVSIVIVAFAALVTFESPTQILLPPLSILMVNIVEGQFLTPMIAGKQLSLSPVAVFLSLVVIGWMWGILGVLMAVPILATVKLVCESVAPLHAVALFLGRD